MTAQSVSSHWRCRWLAVGLALAFSCSTESDEPGKELPAESVRLVEEGRALLANRKVGAARTKAEEALRVSTENPGAHALKARCLWQMSQLDPAVEAYQAGLPYAASGDGTLERELGELAASLKYHDIALEALEAAYGRKALPPKSLGLYASELQSVGRGADAVTVYEELERLEPRQHEWPLERGRCLLDLGELEQARAALEKARGLDNESATVWAELGNLAVQENRLEDADRCFTRSLQLDDRQGRVLSQLAMICSRLGEPERAREYQDRYAELSRLQQEANDEQKRLNKLRNMKRLAEKALAVHQPAEARGYLEHAIALDPDDPDLRRLLLSVYEQLGLEDEAARLRDN
ncbi:MAG: tetratricopeptide repeat protein [Planctomycetota bacterium]